MGKRGEKKMRICHTKLYPVRKTRNKNVTDLQGFTIL